MQVRPSLFALSLLALLPGTALAQKPQTVANFYGLMLTGITVSHKGRIFVNYPHWGDKVDFTVAEIKNGRALAYPNAAINRINKKHPENCFYSVQSVVVDPKDRLWALDTGSVKLMPNVPGGTKLVCIDLGTNKIIQTIRFNRMVVPASTHLNDIRFDLRRGKKGMAFITDSGAKAPNGIVVVDLATGQSWRRLGGHPSVKTDLIFTHCAGRLDVLAGTLSVAANGYLYFTANELELQGRYHFGKDLRVKPYKLYRIRINAQPVLLR